MSEEEMNALAIMAIEMMKAAGSAGITYLDFPAHTNMTDEKLAVVIAGIESISHQIEGGSMQ